MNIRADDSQHVPDGHSHLDLALPAAVSHFGQLMLGLLLWEELLPAGAQSTPLSYMSDGRHYVVAVVGEHDRIPTKLVDYIMARAPLEV